ncbi:MAG TPA: glycosyltransferase 87 family protein [Solirubrobacteraceae bacterium]|nr:glycosyltransferase 87 family protein [Solirubrobacteraceae bacterium]
MSAVPARRGAAMPGLGVVGALAGRTLGELAIVFQAVLGGGIVLAAAERRSVLSSANHGAFTAWFAGPLHGLWPSLPRNADVLHNDFHHALLAMLGAWLVVVLLGRGARPAVVIGGVVVLNALFLLCPPSGLTDLFNYLGYARLDAVHHLNPYVGVPLAQRGDPVYAYSNWHQLSSPYGPLFTLLLLPIAHLPLAVEYWSYKVLATAASLGLLAAVWACARRLGGAPAPAVAFVGLNPLVLVYALGGKHNDLLMMALVMLGCLLLLVRREGAGGAALAAAVAIKASAGLLAPVIVLGAPRRPRAIAGLAVAGLALAALSYAAFGPHLPDLRDQSRLVNTWSVPDLVGYAAGHGGADPAIRRLMAIAMLAGAAVCAAFAWRTRRWATAGAAAGLAGLATVGWLEPWYILWSLPLAAVSGSRTIRFATVLVTAWLVLVWGGVVPTAARAHGIRPGRTVVGRANRRFERSLLRNPPSRSMRDRPRRGRRAPIVPRLHGRAQPPARRAASNAADPHRRRRAAGAGRGHQTDGRGAGGRLAADLARRSDRRVRHGTARGG